MLLLAGAAFAQECPEPPSPAPAPTTSMARDAVPVLLAQGGYKATKPYDFSPSGSPTDSLNDPKQRSWDLAPRGSNDTLGSTPPKLGDPPSKRYGSPRGSGRDG